MKRGRLKMASLPKDVLTKEEGILFAKRRVSHAYRKGQKSITLQKEGVQFCQEVELAILQIVPTAKIAGTADKLFIRF